MKAVDVGRPPEGGQCQAVSVRRSVFGGQAVRRSLVVGQFKADESKRAVFRGE